MTHDCKTRGGTGRVPCPHYTAGMAYCHHEQRGTCPEGSDVSCTVPCPACGGTGRVLCEHSRHGPEPDIDGGERTCGGCLHFHDSYTMDAVWCDREPPGRDRWPHDAENATCESWTPREEG